MSQILRLFIVDPMGLIELMLMFKISHLYIENQQDKIELMSMYKIIHGLIY